MFSGKSTELLRRLRRYSIAQRQCILIKYKGDTRYSEDCVSTHDRVEMAATSSSSLLDVVDAVVDYDVIGVDGGLPHTPPAMCELLFLGLQQRWAHRLVCRVG